jgi:hypothetical protein
MAPATMAVKPKIADRNGTNTGASAAHSGSPGGYPAYQAHVSSLSVRKGSAIHRSG